MILSARTDAGKPTVEAKQIKAAAAGRWEDVLSAVCGIDRELLDGRHHPCPKCGGTDRFRMIDAEAGALYCNKCFSRENGDGIAATQWALGVDFSEALQRLGAHLHLSAPSRPAQANHRPAAKPEGVAYATAAEAVAEIEGYKGPRAGAWHYHNAAGEPVAVVLRFNLANGEKEFRQVSKQADGWRTKGWPKPWPLYNLPAVITADRVIVCEGEKSADAAKRLGLIGTTSPQGAKSPKSADWSPLAGKEAIVFPDNDDPGREYAQAVVDILAELFPPPRVKVVNLPDLGEKGDLADSNISAPELEELIAAAPIAEPTRKSGAAKSRVDETPKNQAENRDCVDVDTCKVEKTHFRPFPLERLPPLVRRLVEEGASSIGCDPSYVAGPALCVLASAIGSTRRLQVKPGWTLQPSLWLVVVGESGSAKTPAIQLAEKVLQERQYRSLKRYEAREAEYLKQREVYDRDLKEWKRRKGNAGDPPETPEEPTAERCLASDTTIEALAGLLSANPRGLLLARDELAGWVNSFDRYAGGKGSDSQAWLSIFSGKTITVDRRSATKKTLVIPRPAVSIMGGIQPDLLRRVLTREHQESGLSARLLMVYPPRKPKRWSEEGISEDTERGFSGVVDRLFSLLHDYTDDGDLTPAVMHLTTEAKAIYREWYEQHNNEQAELSGELARAWSKLEEYALRLALVLCLTQWAESHEFQPPEVVDADSVEGGIALCEWFKNEARRVCGLLGESPEDAERRQLVEWIEKRGGRVTARDVQRGYRRLSGPGEAEQALELLAKEGFGQWIQTGGVGEAGRPTREFSLSANVDIDTTPPIPRETGVSSTELSGEPLNRGEI